MIWKRGALEAPLDDRWRTILDGVARSQRFPESHEIKALGAAVAQLSAFYNGLVPKVPPRMALAARLSFSFPRDVPKGGAAVAEVLPTLSLGKTLRVLDLGAGLGAMTWGVVRALSALGFTTAVEATLVDQDPQALALAARIATEAQREGAVALRVRTLVSDLLLTPSQEADLVLVGQALSEMHGELPADERAERQAAWLHGLLGRSVASGGALVVVEPALRERTRHLHRLRARLIELGHPIFAPCLHDRACPMLENERDWCHEDRPVDLPGWLVPVARAAGLRFEGLTFSYLVIRRDGRTLRELVPAGTLRAVSLPKKTKGKLEIDLCGESFAPEVLRAMRLDRETSEANVSWGEIHRGDLVHLSPSATRRIGREVEVQRITELSR
ncbi:MAG: small ribosomal subunit Rsm22 family protein [Myxococcales bacterium]|nr:small ribosomal subunit Rsm22 family protein [Polyangiaceae bacterium]MDW8250751.1 small ribosomal subunit Rsm22 family protein [Myxococcales bacterium]